MGIANGKREDQCRESGVRACVGTVDFLAK